MSGRISYSISLLFSALFLYAGVSKLMEFDLFEGQLELSPIFHSVAVFITYGLPVLEIILSIILFFPAMQKYALLGAFILMALFTIYVFALIYGYKHLPCSCGGLLEELSWKQHLILNIFLTITAFFGFFLSKNDKLEIRGKEFNNPHP
jgi:uncharacterized membrane protein YphA (DoxX/SURF4 family)